MTLVTPPSGPDFDVTDYEALAYYRREPGYVVHDGVSGPASPAPVVPTWAASTSYTAGQVVQHPTSADLFLRRIATGVSRSSFDATEQATWKATGSAAYLPILGGGALRRRREIPGLWTVTGQNLAPAADIPTQATAGPGGATPIASAVNLPYNTALVTGLGTVDVLNNALGTNYQQNQASNNTGSGATPCARSFDYYGADLAIWFRNNVATQSRFWVWVDGQPCTAAPVASSANAANSKFYYRLTWGSARLRRVTVYMENADFGGMDIGPTDTVFPAPKPGFSIFVVGDSYAAGSLASTALQAYPFTLGQALGAEVYCGGWAGTGYTTSNAYGSAGRIARIATAQPDWIWFVGSINDGATASATTGAAAAQAFTDAKAAAPNAKLLVTSVQANTGTMSAGNIANDAAVAAAAVAAGVLTVQQPIAEGWITGTGKVGTPAGSGNADVFIASDGIHPSQAGHDYYARKMLEGVRAILGA